MPSRPSADHKLNRDDITRKVAYLIADKGLAALTMRTIANEVGCSVGSLPHYFKGKEEIVSAALNWSNERIYSRINTMPEGDVSLDALIPLMISALPLDEQSDIEWRVRLSLWNYAITSPELLATVRETREQAIRLLRQLVVHLQRAGDITRSLNTDTISHTMYHLALGVGFNLLHSPIAERENQVQPLIDYLDGIRS